MVSVETNKYKAKVVPVGTDVIEGVLCGHKDGGEIRPEGKMQIHKYNGGGSHRASRKIHCIR
jgi:hypothetical protein